MSSFFQKLKSYGFFQYGKTIPGLKIHGEDAPYPVLNERAIRAGAGIMLMLGIYAFVNALLLGNFLPLKWVVSFFFIDFFTKVIIGTKFSPVSNLANWIVRKQKPEYVGAIQKRFAWGIGLVLSSTMMVMLFILQVESMARLSICLICLTFMWFETSFGICVGCKIYNFLVNKKILAEPYVRPACPGGACRIS